MNELLIWYEHEVELLRTRIREQNVEISALSRNTDYLIHMYSSLENDYNCLKKEYERVKTECVTYHIDTKQNVESSTRSDSPPPLSL